MANLMEGLQKIETLRRRLSTCQLRITKLDEKALINDASKPVEDSFFEFPIVDTTYLPLRRSMAMKRRTLKDVAFKGFTITEGWKVLKIRTYK